MRSGIGNKMMLPSSQFALGAWPWLLLLLVLARLSDAVCECGYSLNKTTDRSYAVFTEIQETDFLHASTDNLTTIGWQPQEYNVSANDSRGPYGKSMEVRNVVLNPFKNSSAWSGDSEHGGDAGLGLWVRAGHPDGFIEGAELVSTRTDALLGSFRVGMKLSNSSGTCGAFFYYHNNSQEIDMEFLSRQFNMTNQGLVNLVLQSSESVRQGFNAANTAGYHVQTLPFLPDAMFHEYRFDWFTDRVVFYVDGAQLFTMTENIPSTPGSMFLNHWSNGDPSWSAGPPSSDTVMTVSYVKAYFNSSDSNSASDYKKRCPTFNATQVCQIPTQSSPPDPSLGNNAARTWFISGQDGAPPVQGGKHNAAGVIGVRGGMLWVPLVVTMLSCLWI